MHCDRTFLRSFDAGDHYEAFLISAVAAVLGIRFFLDLTGYPTVGGHALHIAHMLWGGLLMLVALGMLFSFLSRAATRLAAIVGGVGFGTFIDEAGKFVTHDNDYFFQPAVAMIYVIFVLTFVAVRMIHRGRSYQPDEYLLNAIHGLEEVVLRDLDEDEKLRILHHLAQSDPANPLVPALRELLERSDLVPVPHPGILARIKEWFRVHYQAMVGTRGFRTGLIVFFSLQFLIRLAVVIMLAAGWRWDGLKSLGSLSRMGSFAASGQTLGFVDWAQLLSSLLSGVFVLAGIVALRTSTLQAYLRFKWSIFLSLFLTQVFIFYQDQFAGLVGLGFNVFVLITLDLMIELERENSQRI